MGLPSGPAPMLKAQVGSCFRTLGLHRWGVGSISWRPRPRRWSRLGVCLRLVDPGLAFVLGQPDDRAVPRLDHLLEVTRVAVAEFLDRIDADALEQLGIFGTDAQIGRASRWGR